MLTTPPNLQFFFTDLETRFWAAYTAAEPFTDKIATTFPSSSAQELHGWMDMIGKARVWTGPRQVEAPGLETYLVKNVLFEKTLGIDKFKIKDDKFGLYYPVVSHLGTQAKKLTDYQLRDLIVGQGYWGAASFQVGTDGVTHWNTAHPVDIYDPSKGTYCNDFTGGGFVVNGINVGGALAPNAYATLWQEFVSRKSQSGEALGLTPNATMIPPQLNITGATILNAQFFAPSSLGNLTGQVGAMDNQLRGTTDLLMVREFSAFPTVWYMLDTTRVVKPFMWQLREAPLFVYRIQEDDPIVFNQHVYLYGFEARGAAAWGLPFLSARSGS